MKASEHLIGWLCYIGLMALWFGYMWVICQWIRNDTLQLAVGLLLPPAVVLCVKLWNDIKDTPTRRR